MHWFFNAISLSFVIRQPTIPSKSTVSETIKDNLFHTPRWKKNILPIKLGSLLSSWSTEFYCGSSPSCHPVVFAFLEASVFDFFLVCEYVIIYTHRSKPISWFLQHLKDVTTKEKKNAGCILWVHIPWCNGERDKSGQGEKPGEITTVQLSLEKKKIIIKVSTWDCKWQSTVRHRGRQRCFNSVVFTQLVFIGTGVP